MAASQKEKTAKTASTKEKTAASDAKRTEVMAKYTKRRNIQAVVLFAIGLLITAFAFFGNVDAEAPNVWDYIHGFFCGVFGITVFFIGPLFIYFAVMIGLKKDKKTITLRIIQIVMFILLFSAAVQIIFVGHIGTEETEGFGGAVSAIFTDGQHLTGGGFFALPLGYPLLLLGRGGATVIIILIIFVIVMVMANIDLITFLRLISKPFIALGKYIKRKKAEYDEESELIRQEEARRRQEEEEQRLLSEGSEEERAVRRSRTFEALERETRPEDTDATRSKHEKNLAEIDKKAKAIVDEQRQESDEFLTKIGAKPAIIPPRLTNEDYRRNEENNNTENRETVREDASQTEPVVNSPISENIEPERHIQPAIAENTAPEIPVQPIAAENRVSEIPAAAERSEQGETDNTIRLVSAEGTTQSVSELEKAAAVIPEAPKEEQKESFPVLTSDNSQKTENPEPAAISAPAANPETTANAEPVKLVGGKEATDNKGGLNEIEKAIADYNREIEDKNKKVGVAVETTVNGETNAQQSPDQVIAAAEEYTLPPVTLLNEVKNKISEENKNAEIEGKATTLVNALNSFGVKTKFLGAVRGPSVTRYELQPAPGVKISKITNLVDDIALNLATAGVRIEAPIPNKAAVGIEVPNREKDTVSIREMIDSDTFGMCESRLGAALGKNISGEVVICDIADMPHILVAGTTGSGKSVCINSIIMSILYRATPEEVRLIMIDPKAVEFMIYNGIGHLLLPVVSDPKKAAGALAWACTEMDKRYGILSSNNVRDIKAYNKLADTRDDLPKMPQIVIFIDELADLMMCAKKDVEDSIIRIAQKARAAGMHLVVATQKPTVDVITGLIKSNIPSRIALKVASQTDSRTIIDMCGADKLLGKGDMLYKSVAMPMPMRVQGCWVSDEEVERVTEFIKNKFALEYDENVMDEVERQAERVGSDDKGGASYDGDLDISDDKLDEAIEVVFSNGGASTSSLQRALKVGYGRAARLVDMMEQMGIVGPPDGNKPRQLLMSKESWYERKLNKQD